MKAMEFYLTMLWFKIRDMFIPPKSFLEEADIQPGSRVLDYGCGAGSYTIPVANLVGASGKVYALDSNPLALQQVQKVAVRKGLGNIELIHTDCAIGLEDAAVDVVLLYDTYHDLMDAGSVLSELYRVLKPGGILSFSDHHMKEEEILSEIAGTGLFKLSKKGGKTYSFFKQG